MPIRYSSYLLVTDAGEGRVRLRYGHITEADRLLVVTGPQPVTPPGREFTRAEFDRWQFDLTCGTGYGIRLDWSINPNKPHPAVEVSRTYEDEIPKGSVSWALAWMRSSQTHEPTVGVTVRNGWDRPIPEFCLAAAFDAGMNLPVPGAPAELGLRDAGAGSESAFVRVGPPIGGGDLVPHLPAAFAFSLDFYPGLRDRAAVLSPDQHWIELRTAGYEFDRIPGKAVADFLDTDPPA